MNTRIGFSTPKHFNPVSWLVRKVTSSAASHCFFIYFDVDWQADMVLEAHEFGFRLMSLSRFEKRNEVVATFNTTIDIGEGLKHVALEFRGTSGDEGGLLGAAVVMLGRWLKRKWRNPLNSSQSVFCSEAVTLALQKSGYPGADGLVPHSTTPQDLLTFFTHGSGSAGLPAGGSGAA